MLDVRKIRLILELREAGISNAKVLSAIEKIPREEFIHENFRNQAYENIALPIDQNQTISQPFVVAKMTELLDVKSHHKILEVGTGSGYQCSILSSLVSCFISSKINSLAEGSKPEVASSRIKKSGFLRRALAISNLLFIPPLKSLAL